MILIITLNILDYNNQCKQSVINLSKNTRIILLKFQTGHRTQKEITSVDFYSNVIVALDQMNDVNTGRLMVKKGKTNVYLTWLGFLMRCIGRNYQVTAHLSRKKKWIECHRLHQWIESMRVTAIQFGWMKWTAISGRKSGRKRVTFDLKRDQRYDLPPEDRRNQWMFEALDRARTVHKENYGFMWNNKNNEFVYHNAVLYIVFLKAVLFEVNVVHVSMVNKSVVKKNHFNKS